VDALVGYISAGTSRVTLADNGTRTIRIPKVPLDIPSRSAPLLVVLMFYHTLWIAFSAFHPSTSTMLFLDRRVDFIARNWVTLLALEKAGTGDEHDHAELELAIKLATSPMVYARIFWMMQEHGRDGS
jgi:hypothetical protein